METEQTIKRGWIVFQDMEVIGGCCPDLPDSIYLDLEDAKRRVKELFDDMMECWTEQGLEPHGEISDDGWEGEINSPKPHFWFKAYIGGSVPIIEDYDKDWEFLNLKTK